MSEPLIGIRALSFFIYLAELGQPDVSKGGIVLPDGEEASGRYFDSEWRFGLVLAVGPGHRSRKGKLIPMGEPMVGDVVMYSRRVGQKLDMQYDHPEYGRLWIRVIDKNQCDCVVEDFVPWWDPEKCQKSPKMHFNS